MHVFRFFAHGTDTFFLFFAYDPPLSPIVPNVSPRLTALWWDYYRLIAKNRGGIIKSAEKNQLKRVRPTGGSYCRQCVNVV